MIVGRAQRGHAQNIVRICRQETLRAGNMKIRAKRQRLSIEGVSSRHDAAHFNAKMPRENALAEEMTAP